MYGVLRDCKVMSSWRLVSSKFFSNMTRMEDVVRPRVYQMEDMNALAARLDRMAWFQIDPTKTMMCVEIRCAVR
jgi:hypothetical protein